MNKPIKLGFIILIIACTGMGLYADDSESKPLQLALWNPYQLVPAETDIHGLRLNFLYGKNRNVKGIDLGLVNESKGDFSGIEGGLLINIVNGNVSGLQAALFANGTDGTGSVKGIQAALFSNGAENVRGVQIAMYNGSETVKGVQLGLLWNLRLSFFDDYTEPWSVEEAYGMQIALLNCCKKMTGVQIGFYNWSNEMRGIQIGIINVINEGPVKVFPILNVSF